MSCVEGRPLPSVGTPEPKSKMSKKSATPPSNRKVTLLKSIQGMELLEKLLWNQKKKKKVLKSFM